MRASQNDWRKLSLCAQTPALRGLAFGDSEDEDEPHSTEDAEWFRDQICYSCPVMIQCKAWVDEFPQTHGVIGGETAFERNGETADNPSPDETV